MRRAALLCLGISIPAVLLAADLFAQLGWEQSDFEDTCFQFVANPEFLPRFPVTPAMRALAITQRRGAVEAIAAKAKAYYASDAFKARWAEHRRGALNGGMEPEERAAQEAQEAQAMEQSMQQMEAMMGMVPPEAQAQMKEAMAKAKADRARKEAKAKSRKPDVEPENAPPKDPRVNLRKALQHFLAATDGVDYGAATSLRGGRRYFANPAFEAKPDTWKMTFRAGREASEGVRAQVRTWLAEIK